jgi:hypothetical protein
MNVNRLGTEFAFPYRVVTRLGQAIIRLTIRKHALCLRRPTHIPISSLIEAIL